jgi:hypothetical protein
MAASNWRPAARGKGERWKARCTKWRRRSIRPRRCNKRKRPTPPVRGGWLIQRKRAGRGWQAGDVIDAEYEDVDDKEATELKPDAVCDDPARLVTKCCAKFLSAIVHISRFFYFERARPNANNLQD